MLRILCPRASRAARPSPARRIRRRVVSRVRRQRLRAALEGAGPSAVAPGRRAGGPPASRVHVPMSSRSPWIMPSRRAVVCALKEQYMRLCAVYLKISVNRASVTGSSPGIKPKPRPIHCSRLRGACHARNGDKPATAAAWAGQPPAPALPARQSRESRRGRPP